MEDDKMKEVEAKEKKAEAEVKKIGPVEKVSIVAPEIASEHTTFYNRKQTKGGNEFIQL